jgi:MADS-box transcription factor
LALLLRTLTQRKTGLFKKAYELGVLCSVDVAVIIFGTFSFFLSPYHITLFCPHRIRVSERKPGHADKLFQYCSTDINALVQRQIRVRNSRTLFIAFLFPQPIFLMQFDGERDLRTPQDFSGGATASRADDMPDDDDDDGDAEDSPVLQYLRHDSLKGKSDPESSLVPRPKRELPEVRSTLVSLP